GPFGRYEPVLLKRSKRLEPHRIAYCPPVQQVTHPLEEVLWIVLIIEKRVRDYFPWTHSSLPQELNGSFDKWSYTVIVICNPNHFHSHASYFLCNFLCDETGVKTLIEVRQ